MFQDLLSLDILSSDVRHLFHLTNISPEVEDAIRLMLFDAERLLAIIDDDLSTLSNVVGHLQERKRILKEYMAEHAALLSPINRLFPDVLEQIFLHCLPDQTYVEMDSHPTPIILGQVCRSWHDVSRSTPRFILFLSAIISSKSYVQSSRLWSSVKVQLRVTSPALTSRLSRWLKMSGALPLTLCITEPHSLSRHNSISAGVMLLLDSLSSLLEAYSERWQKLEFRYLSPASMKIVFATLCNTTPLLKSLLFMGRGVEEQRLETIVSPYWSSEVLDDLALVSTRFNMRRLYSQFCLTRILRLTLISDKLANRLTTDDALKILGYCPGIVECTLDFGRNNFTLPRDPTTDKTIVLPRLQELTVDGGDIGPLFDGLVLPRMRHLRYEDTPLGNYQSIVDLLTRSCLRGEWSPKDHGRTVITTLPKLSRPS